MANSSKEQFEMKTNNVDTRGKEEAKRFKKVEASIRSKVAAEERAHKIVERLVLDDEVTDEFLLNSGNFLTPNHYADVVEERFLSHECGYPLCHNKLSKVPSQKYKISTKTNRVYDITERKCFCSNFCYKASKYFESQISASPLWTRLGESPKTFSLLKGDVVSRRTGAGNVLLGEEKDQNSQSIEIKDLCSMDVQPDSTESAQNDVSFHEDFKGQPSINMIMKQNAVESDKDRTGNVTDGPKLSGELLKGGEHDHTICGRDVGVNINVPPSSSSPPSSSLGSSWCSSSPSITTALITNTSSQGYSESDTLFSCLQSNKPADLKESLSENVAFLRSVRNVLRSWCTPMTLEYLGLSHTMRSKGCDGESDQEGSLAPGLITAKAAKFPRPASNVQVQSKADSEIGSSGKISPKNIIIKENKNFSKDVVCVLPPIDSRSQHTIRRRIVLDSLFQTLPDLLSDLKLTVGDISRDLTGLVHTFSLNSQTVTLKPLQWKMIGLALIQLLRKKNSLVSVALQTSPENFRFLLCRVKITQQELDSVMFSILPCQPQYLGLSEQSFCRDDSLETSETIGDKLELVGPERVDYGDMEELD